MYLMARREMRPMLKSLFELVEAGVTASRNLTAPKSRNSELLLDINQLTDQLLQKTHCHNLDSRVFIYLFN